ncbi:MAG: glycosyltransferase family 2 protein [Anaerolineaceae bacterium]|nr:glycosyltransferase family 2 protein [Anaerolineaceae bacterium]
MKLLTVVIPCYNSQNYMQKCINSVLPGGEDLEVLIINDGSTDNTGVIADFYASRYPSIVKVIHQKNKGHGGAINTGIKNAKGIYFKVVDSDDWIDSKALLQIINKLQQLRQDRIFIDMLVSNYIYDKQGVTRKAVMNYEKILPKNRIFSWNEAGHFRKGKYLLMHSIIYKTSVLHECGLQLPEHTFYVDNLFVYLPLPYIKTMYYLSVDFYHYYIGRDDQSINEKVMIERIDQQIKVNKLMIELVDLKKLKNQKTRRYMFNYLEIITMVTAVLLIRSGEEGNFYKRKAFWKYIKGNDLWLYLKLRFGVMGMALNLPGKIGRKITVKIYTLSRYIYGFN